MNTVHTPSDASIFVAAESTILVMGHLLDESQVPTDHKLLLYQSPTTRRFLRWRPDTHISAVDDISPDMWEDSVDIGKIEEMLAAFEPAAAHILRVIDHSYLHSLLG